ncbi:hypothetical protein RSO68_08065 [Halomonas saccharevitans]|uniref:Pre-peptidase C-terminal domain-containing protein n=1 Tax=Halomonas saccharevitans TaxID=416872 RepID=A0ABU3NEF4_9GAMM|nr:hypothetical protein [Halomonas saccharevitans]MDT8879422.1 hypothetical protein [Halomonas saccharevitans]
MVVQAIRKASGHAVLRPHRLLIGAAGLVLLAGCAEEEARFVSAPEATLGSDIAGELTSASDVNLSDGTRVAAHWLCSEADGSASSMVRYELEAPFAARLSAFGEQGQWLGSVTSEPEGERAALTASAEACTLVAISGQDDGAFGPYRLEAEPASLATEFETDRPLVGRLEDGRAEHPLTLEAPAWIDLSLSGDANVGLRLVGDGVSQQASACVPGELRLDAYLDAGEYRVEVERGDTAAEVSGEACERRMLGTGGIYRLEAKRNDLADGRRNAGPLRDGDRITGSLESASSNVYTLAIDEPSSITLALRSSAFDTVLRVVGEGNELVDDDGGNDTDSRLQTVLMPGEYRVEVSGYGEEQGEYALDVSLDAFDGELHNGGALTLGESLGGNLSGNGVSNTYRFEVDAVSEVELALDSGAFDPVLRLYGNGIELRDDDGGGDRNSLITTVLQPGEYRLDVESYSGTGTYRLRTEQRAFEGRIGNGGEVAPGEVIYGQLSPGRSLTYRLVLEAARDVVIESTSGSVDTVLDLRGNGVNEQNDDAGDLGYGSRIHRYLEPGTYEIEVSGYGSSDGRVRLAIGG